jgi:DNA-binding NarL/FixJ family response regulator
MGRARILIAEDHADTRELLAQLLALEHDVVALVGDGKAAVAAASQLEPDLAVLDISMPVMNGLTAARHLKQSARPPKVVFITCHAEAAYVDEASRLGAEGYVLKPNLISELGDAILAVLAGGRYRSPRIQ